MEREFDILLWGAAGWTGIHLVEYFAENYPPSSGLRWAMCARSESKLKQVVKRLEKEGHDWINSIETIVVDNMDEEKVMDVVSRAFVVASVVGPYALYGENIVRACVKKGTHYCDITGELQWIREMIDKYHKEAEENRVYIVPSCGFDSVPSDIGTFVLANFMWDEFGEKCKQIKAYLVGGELSNLGKDGKKGGKPGGGTLASLLAANVSMKAMRAAYYLTEKDDKQNADSNHVPQVFMGYEKYLSPRRYTVSWPMAFVNEKNVRRSNYLLNYKYGVDFSYHEAGAISSFCIAFFITVMILPFYGIVMVRCLRRLLLKVVPKQSQWPPERPENFNPGSFELEFIGKTEKNKLCKLQLKYAGDPAYAGSSVMLGESAMVLLRDVERVKEESGWKGGVLTSAVLGKSLVERLRNKGMIIEPKKLELKNA